MKRDNFFEVLERRDMPSVVSFYVPDAIGTDYFSIQGAIVKDLNGNVVNNGMLLKELEILQELMNLLL